MLCLSISQASQAQFTVDTIPRAVIANRLVQHILGKNISYSNAKIRCLSAGAALFKDKEGIILGLDSGIILGTGYDVYTVANPHSFIYQTHEYDSIYVDTLYRQLVKSDTIYDKCDLEFDFVPIGDSLRFDYVFATEEFPLFNCTGLNDAFGLFLSGPGINGIKNIALIPNTTVPICLNTIFDTMPGFYKRNLPNGCTAYGFNSPYTQYGIVNDTSTTFAINGFTKVFTARHKVNMGGTYHIKFTIADVGDHVLNSAVLIGSRSFRATSIVMSTPYSTGGVLSKQPYMLEGCGPVRLNFRTAKKLDTNMRITLKYGGSAIMGVDYDTLPTSFWIMAGDSTFDLNISPKPDTHTEPIDSLIIYATNGGIYYDTIVYRLHDAFAGYSVFNQTNDTTLCNRSAGQLYIQTQHDIQYQVRWSPPIYLSDTTRHRILVTPVVAVGTDSLIYRARVTHAGCAGFRDSLSTIRILHRPTITMPRDTGICWKDTLRIFPVLSTPGSYTYSWTPTTYQLFGSSSSLNLRAIPLLTTKYKLKLTVPNGCISEDSVQVKVIQMSKLMDSIQKIPANCHGLGGSILIRMKNPDTNLRFRIQNQPWTANPDFLGLKDTSYRVSIRYRNFCQFDTTIILPRAAFKIRADVQHPSCNQNNGYIAINATNASPPINYTWSPTNPATNFYLYTNVGAGIYKVTASDMLACKDSLTIRLFPADTPRFTLTLKDAICTNDNGKLVLTNLSGRKPFALLWSTGNTADSITGLAGASYQLRITDSLGCQFFYEYSIQNKSKPIISYTAKPVTCITDKGSIQIRTTGGQAPLSYACSNGASTNPVTGLSGNRNYTISVTDANQCRDSAVVFIDSIIKLSATAQIDSSYCSLANGQIRLIIQDGSAPFSYAWSNGTNVPNQTAIKAGNYSVTITDQYNCSIAVAGLRVENIAPNWQNLTTKKDILCYGDTTGEIAIRLTGGRPGYTYQLNSSNYTTQNDYTRLVAATYTYRVRDIQGCEFQDVLTLTQPPILRIDSSQIRPTNCYASQDGMIHIWTSGGVPPHQYLWSNLKTQSKIDLLARGNYRVTITDANRCTRTTDYTVPSPDSFPAKATISDLKCYEDSTGSIEVKLLGGFAPYRYLWSTGDTSQKIQRLLSGSYSLQLIDQKGCQEVKNYIVKTPAILEFEDIEINHPRCYGERNGSIRLRVRGGTPNYTYRLLDQRDQVSSVYYPYLDSGRYHVLVKDAHQCELDSAVSLISPSRKTILLSPKDTQILVGEMVQLRYQILTGNQSVRSILWSPGQGLSCIDCESPEVQNYVSTTYTMTLIDTLGCQDSAKAAIFIRDSLVLFIPTAFSPNGDKLNDEFRIYGKYVASSHLLIYNRWGEKVFETVDAYGKGWDGSYRGALAPTGNYSYRLRLKTLSQKIIEKNGELMLVR